MKKNKVGLCVIIALSVLMNMPLANVKGRGCLKLAEVNNIDDTICAVYPENNATVVLANDLVYEYYNNYNWENSDVTPYYRHEDIYMPEYVTLQWSDTGADYYIARISQNENMSASESYIIISENVELRNLFTDTTYYWQIETVTGAVHKMSPIFSFYVAESPRTVYIEGVNNTRDAGGKKAGDGYRMKEGMFYRGSRADDITDAGREHAISEFGIKTELDIRMPREQLGFSAFGEDVNYVAADGPYYTQIFQEEYREALATEIKTFAEPNNYPIYAHCAAGRDRTGTIAMLIEGLLGVDKNTIMMDYQLSVFSRYGTYDDALVLYGNALDTYEKIEEKYGANTFSENVERFMLSIGVTKDEIASIRNIMLEEAK